MEQQIQDVITQICRYDKNDPKRQKTLNRLLIIIQQLPGIYHSSHQDYPEAFNRTLEWVSKNIDRFEPKTTSIQQSLVIGINGYLSRLITIKMHPTKSSNPTILLDLHAHRYAEQFASEQATSTKGDQVYLNTLSVYAVHSYLKGFSIKTALHQSDCWYPDLRAIFNVADLILPNLGKLECRWVLPREETIFIPTEARENRLGYIFLLFTEELDRVELLGFIPGEDIKRETESIAISQLQSIDAFFETIHQLQVKVNLHQWFIGLFTQDWQPVESIIKGRMITSLSIDSLATSISRGKILSLKQSGIEQQIILVLTLTSKSTTEAEVCLQIYPIDAQDNLPPGLSVKVLDELGNACLEAKTNNADDWIELEFDCRSGEDFSLQIIWGEMKLLEQFEFLLPSNS